MYSIHTIYIYIHVSYTIYWTHNVYVYMCSAVVVEDE